VRNNISGLRRGGSPGRPPGVPNKAMNHPGVVGERLVELIFDFMASALGRRKSYGRSAASSSG
jgi:hypothetical protein